LKGREDRKRKDIKEKVGKKRKDIEGKIGRGKILKGR